MTKKNKNSSPFLKFSLIESLLQQTISSSSLSIVSVEFPYCNDLRIVTFSIILSAAKRTKFIFFVLSQNSS